MAIIPKRTLDDIRFRCTIEDVIGATLKLARAGGSYRGLCPFHKEKTPSFHVNPQRQIFHCFGCGVGGDVFKFVMMHENVDFMTAAKMLAERAGVRLEIEDGGREGGVDKAQLFRAMSDAALFYHKQLLENKSASGARRYLAGRNLAEDVIKAFQIGYAPDGWDTILNWGRQHKYGADVLETVGLVLRKDDGKRDPYDRFRNRVMFPIRDEQGRVVGFSGRALEESDKSAKYVNSPETPLFRKSRVLYALDVARKHIVDAREAIVCEGQIDVIRCHAAGFHTAVAAQGTAFTEEHMHVLRRYADSAILVFDPDRAGQDAAIRTAGVFMDAGLAVRVAKLPTGKDPDLFIREGGKDAFQNVLAKATSAVVFQIDTLSAREDIKSEAGLMRISKAVLQTIARCPSATQREILLQEAADRLRVPIKALRDDLAAQARRERPKESPKPGVPQKVERLREEVELCEHLVHAGETPDIAAVVERCLPMDMIQDELCRSVASICIAAARKKSDVQEALWSHPDVAGLQEFATALLMTPPKVQSREYSRIEAVRDILLRIWHRRLKRERAEQQKRFTESGDEKAEARCRQLTYDLKALSRWETGEAVIEMEKSG